MPLVQKRNCVLRYYAISDFQTPGMAACSELIQPTTSLNSWSCQRSVHKTILFSNLFSYVGNLFPHIALSI